MRVGLLGGLEVLDDDKRDVLVAGAKLRSLLAVLALHVGRVVPADQLVDALWGDDPPSAVRNGLQGLVSKLRRTLGSADLVGMRSDGYVLELPDEAVDVRRYEQLVAAGRAAAADGELLRAVELLTQADALWRGDALADFAYDDFASGAISRLSELRLAVIEERVDIELGLGRHHGVIVELDSLVASHPLREGLRGALMVALYRAARQADALRIYQEGRHLLGEELGLEPSPELRRLEAAILAQDPSLDAPVVEPHAGAPPVHRAAIPESLTPLVGRDEELRELQRLFADRRLVTLVGPGGVGKTRLALEVARAESAVLSAGGCFVELAPIGQPDAIGTAIASALDLPDPRRVAEMIGAREMLLVLDNCEHVIAAAAEVAEDLLRRCPNLRLLATSREALRVGGETVWPVPPLGADDAVHLFVTRAHAAGAPLELTDDTLPVIADICARLDGLPLAVELAAARTRAFTVSQIASRLNDRFRLLTGGSRTALARQQTLRAVVDWSYELLFDDEQRVFERLSVLPGGADLPTVEAVCADETLATADLEDVVHALVDKSLVIAEPSGDDVRFVQLQTLAQYGREKLAERGEAARVRDAMAAHFAGLTAGSAAAYIGDHQRAWLIAIDREQDNLRAALEWAVANDDAETALTIAGGGSWPHWLAGTVIEGKRWLDDAFACGGEASDRARALALTGRGLLAFQSGEREHVDADFEAALAIFRNIGDVSSAALTHSFYAEVAAARGDIDDARKRRLELLAFYEARPDDPFVVAARAYSRGKLGVLDGDLVAAEHWYREAADGFSRIDRPVMSSMSLGMVADFDERAGDLAAAIKRLHEGIELSDAVGLRGFMGALFARLGWALLGDGDVGGADDAYAQALDLARTQNHRPIVFLALAGSAAIHRLRGRTEAATEAAVEALALHEAGGPRRLSNRVDAESDVRTAAAVCCAVLGAIASDAGDRSRATQLVERAEGLLADAGTRLPALLVADVDRTRALLS